MFAEGWTGEATFVDISGWRYCSRGAHSGVWQSLWKWWALLCLLKATAYIVLQGNVWHLKCDLYSRGHQTWSTTVVFGSRLWAGGAQSSRVARWGWWGYVLQTPQKLHNSILLVFYICILTFTLPFFSFSPLFIRWLSRIHRCKANCPGTQCQCVVQCGDEGWWDEFMSTIIYNAFTLTI